MRPLLGKASSPPALSLSPSLSIPLSLSIPPSISLSPSLYPSLHLPLSSASSISLSSSETYLIMTPGGRSHSLTPTAATSDECLEHPLCAGGPICVCVFLSMCVCVGESEERSSA